MPSQPITPKKMRMGSTFGRMARKPTLTERNMSAITSEDDDEGQCEALDLPGDDVGRGAGQEHERAGEPRRGSRRGSACAT